MSTKDQLKAMQAEIESHVENLRQLRKQAVLDDANDRELEHYAEAIKSGGWMVEEIRLILFTDTKNWTGQDGTGQDDRSIPVTYTVPTP